MSAPGPTTVDSHGVRTRNQKNREKGKSPAKPSNTDEVGTSIATPSRGTASGNQDDVLEDEHLDERSQTSEISHASPLPSTAQPRPSVTPLFSKRQSQKAAKAPSQMDRFLIQQEIWRQTQEEHQSAFFDRMSQQLQAQLAAVVEITCLPQPAVLHPTIESDPIRSPEVAQPESRSPSQNLRSASTAQPSIASRSPLPRNVSFAGTPRRESPFVIEPATASPTGSDGGKNLPSTSRSASPTTMLTQWQTTLPLSLTPRISPLP